MLDNSWIDYPVDGIRFRLRRPGNDELASGIPELVPLVKGEILPSVSRRHPLRDSVDLWTSGNRVFRCTHRLVMMLILGAMQRRVDPISVVEDEVRRKLRTVEALQLKRVIGKLQQLIEVEQCENLAFRQRYERHVDFSPN